MHRQSLIDSKGYLKSFNQIDKELNNGEKVVKIFACGDTGPVRNLEQLVIEKGPEAILGDVREILSTGDLVFANLEVPFSKRGTPINKIPVFRINPDAISIIKSAQINIVSLANNHIFDYGFDAFNDTIELLRTSGIRYFGAGKTDDEAKKPEIICMNDVRIGFLGFLEIDSKIKNLPSGITPTGVTPQMYYENIKKAIKHLRPKVDWIILSLHFGIEYQLYPSPKDVKLCRALIDNGADIILGHHPHYPQGLERYKNGLIAYSLGNFIWDQNFAGHTDSSFILEIIINKKQIQSVRVIPTRLNLQYNLEINNNHDSFEKLNNLSTILLSDSLLNEKWYFICRNKFIELNLNLFKAIARIISQPYFLMVWIRSLFHPNTIYTLKSLIKSILSLKAIQYEMKKRSLKRRLKN